MLAFLKSYLRVPFAMIVWVMETFAANRGRVARFMRHPVVARVFRVLFVVTVIAWIAIAFYFGDEEAGRRFNEAIREYVPQTRDWEILKDGTDPPPAAE